MSTTRQKSLARLPLALAVMASLYGPHLLAQQAQQTTETTQQSEDEEQAAESSQTTLEAV